MNWLKKSSENQFYLHVKVRPNSKMQQIEIDNYDPSSIIIKLRSKPTQNKANKELLKLLKKKLNLTSDQIVIVSGMKNSSKIIQLVFLTKVDETEIIEKLTR